MKCTITLLPTTVISDSRNNGHSPTVSTMAKSDCKFNLNTNKSVSIQRTPLQPQQRQTSQTHATSQKIMAQGAYCRCPLVRCWAACLASALRSCRRTARWISPSPLAPAHTKVTGTSFARTKWKWTTKTDKNKNKNENYSQKSARFESVPCVWPRLFAAMWSTVRKNKRNNDNDQISEPVLPFLISLPSAAPIKQSESHTRKKTSRLRAYMRANRRARVFWHRLHTSTVVISAHTIDSTHNRQHTAHTHTLRRTAMFSGEIAECDLQKLSQQRLQTTMYEGVFVLFIRMRAHTCTAATKHNCCKYS